MILVNFHLIEMAFLFSCTWKPKHRNKKIVSFLINVKYLNTLLHGVLCKIYFSWCLIYSHSTSFFPFNHTILIRLLISFWNRQRAQHGEKKEKKQKKRCCGGEKASPKNSEKRCERKRDGRQDERRAINLCENENEHNIAIVLNMYRL